MRQAIGIAAFFLMVMVPSFAHAEWFIEPYLGATFTTEEDVDVSATAPGVVIAGTFSDVDFEDSLLLGIRAGYWFPAAPNIGIGLDLFHFSPDIKSQTTTLTASAAVVVGDTLVVGSGTGPATLGSADINVIGLTPELLLRLKLMESPDFPDGKFQPYVTAGPAIFFIDLDDEDETQVGIQVGAGVKWMFTKNLGLFAEYRYMSARDVEFEESEGASTVKIETDFNSHSVLGGLSFWF